MNAQDIDNALSILKPTSNGGIRGKSKANNAILSQHMREVDGLLKACIAAEKHHQGMHSEIGTLLRSEITKAKGGMRR